MEFKVFFFWYMILKIAEFYRFFNPFEAEACPMLLAIRRTSAQSASCDCEVSRLEASLLTQVCRHHKPCLDTRNDNSKARINLGSMMFKLKILC